MSKRADAVACGIRAADNFRAGWYCSEAVFRAMSAQMNVTDNALLAVASGFSSGVARHGGMCGALSGAIMALGLARGRQHAQDSVEPVYDTVNAMIQQFRDRFGALNCCDLLDGCDLNTDEGRTRFREERKHRNCLTYTQGAAEICGALLEQRP